MLSKTKIIAIQLAVLSFFTIIWEIISGISAKINFLLGTPVSIIKALYFMVTQENFMFHFALTGGEALVGFLIGTSLGTLIGLGLWYSQTLARISKPFILAIGTVPVFAFAPLLVVWFGVGFWMKVILAVLSTFFIAFSQAFRGATTVSDTYLDLLDVYKASSNSKFFKIILPASIDWVLSSLRLNIGFALLGAFIGEFISSEAGLGRLILRATGLYQVPRALAAALGMVVLALLFDAGANWVESRRHSLTQFLSVPKNLRHTKLWEE